VAERREGWPSTVLDIDQPHQLRVLCTLSCTAVRHQTRPLSTQGGQPRSPYLLGYFPTSVFSRVATICRRRVEGYRFEWTGCGCARCYCIPVLFCTLMSFERGLRASRMQSNESSRAAAVLFDACQQGYGTVCVPLRANFRRLPRARFHQEVDAQIDRRATLGILEGIRA
jgi:hypothetical protein